MTLEQVHAFLTSSGGDIVVVTFALAALLLAFFAFVFYVVGSVVLRMWYHFKDCRDEFRKDVSYAIWARRGLEHYESVEKRPMPSSELEPPVYISHLMGAIIEEAQRHGYDIELIHVPEKPLAMGNFKYQFIMSPTNEAYRNGKVFPNVVKIY